VPPGELEVRYQPQVALGSGKIVGMEAHIRWETPTRRLIPPAELTAVAEMNGTIVSIGNWALREACHQASLWQTRHPGDAPLVSVDASIKQFQHPDFADEVATALEETALDPRNLALELKEGAIKGSTPRVADTIGKLKALGVRLVIDDFGAEKTALLSLARFRADAFKLDHWFVDELERDGEGAANLVAAIAAFAQAMSVEAVATGVETGAQATCLQEVGWEVAQGTFFSEPLSAAAAIEVLTGNNSSWATYQPERGGLDERSKNKGRLSSGPRRHALSPVSPPTRRAVGYSGRGRPDGSASQGSQACGGREAVHPA
jgi:EAL domain-containing protein (putative c-di-GMP-specific phosphodiesterase class I)